MTGRNLATLAATLIVAVFSHQVATVTAQYLWFRTSDLYGETMYIVRASEDLKKVVGTSLVVGWPIVSRSVYRGVGEVTASLPIQGSLGKATVLVRAKNAGGNWEYQQLEARVQFEASSIDLMPHAWRPQKLALRGSGHLYFVGIGKVSRVDVDDLAHDYSERYGVEIVVLPSIAYDAQPQWATRMIRVLKAGYPDLAADPRSVIVAITDVDMDWFSWRDDERFAVVSTAGLTRNEFLKQVTKNVGLLWFELPTSADSRSVLYDAVGGRVDLDLMSDEF